MIDGKTSTGFAFTIPRERLDNMELADTAAVSPAQGQTITINVYGAPGQDINKLADVIEARLSWKMERRKESFA